VTSIIYSVWLNSLRGKLVLTISPSDEDDIGVLRGRSGTTSRDEKVGSRRTPWKVDEIFIGTNDDDIRMEAEAAIREMGGEIIDRAAM
jgi:hypothetical protein|tara:strand:- start:256 stop:519 length:264 start_codon:yes stop_codon:yes gene_type:complete